MSDKQLRSKLIRLAHEKPELRLEILPLLKQASPRPLREIAREIRKDWGSKVNYAAKPYLEAMSDLSSIHDSYGYDSGQSIVRYFLTNAGSWRGPVAKAIKAELKAMLKSRRAALRAEILHNDEDGPMSVFNITSVSTAEVRNLAKSVRRRFRWMDTDVDGHHLAVFPQRDMSYRDWVRHHRDVELYVDELLAKRAY